MSIRPKTVRRLLIVFASVAVLVVTVVGIRWYKAERRIARLAADREAGIVAHRNGDYADALTKLRDYIRRDTRDFDALYAYASSRARLELPNGRHIPEAIQLFEMLRSLRPTDRQVHHALLDLYTQAGMGTEAITLSDTVLDASPQDVEALRAKTIALWRLARYDEALVESLKWNEAAPLQLAGHTQTYLLLIRTRAPKDQILTRYRELLERYPDDPRFEMLLAIATGDAGDRDGALRLLRSAAQRTPPDADFVAQLARIFDQQRLFDESQKILERAAERSNDPAIIRVLVQRLWQNGQYEAVLTRLSSLDAASTATDSNLLAFRALALLSLDRLDEGKALIETLRSRDGDNLAQGWASALSARLEAQTLSPTQLISRYQGALSRAAAGNTGSGGGDNGIIRYWLAEAHLRLGEIDSAIRQWQMSAELMPSWAAPHVQIARALLSRNRPGEAVEAAASAVRCAPDQVVPLTTLALARYALLQQAPSSTDEQRLAQLVGEIQRLRPSEPQTLPLHVTLLCRAGRADEAAEAIRAALPSAEHAWDPRTLANLIAASREYSLSLEDELLAATESSARRSPQMALQHALDAARFREGGVAQGRDALEEAVKSASVGAEAMAWHVALAQFREATDDPAAPETWIALGDAHPEDFSVQSLILESAVSTRSDAEFWSRTIDRVRKLTGEDGSLWRVARARLLLSRDRAGASASLDLQRDSAEAVGLLSDLVRAAPNVPEYRVLLAKAMENLGNDREAAQQLAAAAEIDPRSVAVQMDLARLLIEQGRSSDARQHLERAAQSALIEPAQRLPLARMLADAGRPDRALVVLEAAPARTVAGDLLLAGLYRRLDRDEEAGAIYDRLLTPNGGGKINPDAVLDAADFAASRGDLSTARRRLSLLDGLGVPEARLHLMLAQFEERWGSKSDAAAHLRAATEASGRDAGVWRSLAMLHVRLGQFDSALAAIDRGLDQAPNVELRSLRLQVQAMRQVSDDPSDLTPLIDALAADESRAGDVEALRTLRETLATTQPSAAQIARLRQSADRFTQFLPLQAALAQAYLQSNQPDEAAAVAHKLLDAAPQDANAMALATTIFRSARQWPSMMTAARAWRSAARGADPSRGRGADLAIAEAAFRLRRPTETLRVLEPHLSAAVASPNDNAALIDLAASAMFAADRVDRAEQLLSPLLSASPSARLTWMRLVGESVKDAEVAKRWLASVRPMLNLSTASEQLAFARSAVSAGTRLGATPLFDSALETLNPLLQTSQPDPDALYIAAAAHLRCERWEDARPLLKRVLESDPNHAAAANDLAWTLLASRGDLNEARQLASRAVATQPGVGTFHETLARIDAELGRRDAALAGFDAALRLEPSNIDALIGKAHLLRRTGDAAGARRVLAQVEPLLSKSPPLSSLVRGQLQELKAELSRGE